MSQGDDRVLLACDHRRIDAENQPDTGGHEERHDDGPPSHLRFNGERGWGGPAVSTLTGILRYL